MIEPITAEDAEETLAKYGPDDVAEALAYAAKHGGDPEWLAALERHPAGGGVTGKRSHRRGRRG
jgi:hypothetical protein